MRRYALYRVPILVLVGEVVQNNIRNLFKWEKTSVLMIQCVKIGVLCISMHGALISRPHIRVI